MCYTQVQFGTSFNQICRTVSGPSPNQKCVLPFKHGGKLYNKCPKDPEAPGKYWCSTQTDDKGNHISGKDFSYRSRQ